MKALPNQIAATLVLVMMSPMLRAEQKTENYTGTFFGNPCQVTVNWANFSGQGAVDGRIVDGAGVTFPFRGINPRSGYLELSIEGQTYQLQKQNAGDQISWNSPNLSFSRTSTAPGNPGATPTGTSSNPPAAGGGATRRYTGLYRGKPFTATLTWERPDGSGSAQGTMIIEGDMAATFKGTETRPGFLEVEVSADNSINHKLSKGQQGMSTEWKGEYLTLNEVSSAPLGGYNPPTSPVAPYTPPKPPVFTPPAATTPAMPAPPSFVPPKMPTPPTFNPTGTTPPPTMPAPPTFNPTGTTLPATPGTPPVPAAGGTKWVIACEAEGSARTANAAVDRWRARGFSASSLWIPDYSSLSGAKLWLVHVGSFDYSQKAEAQRMLIEVKKHYKDAYGIKIDNSGKRETF